MASPYGVHTSQVTAWKERLLGLSARLLEDGRAHLAYKAQHVVDLDTEMPLAAEIYTADSGGSLELDDTLRLRKYIPEPQHKLNRRWSDKPEAYQRVVYNNRRRTNTKNKTGGFSVY